MPKLASSTAKAAPHKLYRPGNASEGDGFEVHQCTDCRKRRWCRIILLSHAFQVDHPQYPQDLREDEDGGAYCARRDTGPPRPRGRTRSRRQLNFDSLLVQAPARRAVAGSQQLDAHCLVEAMGQTWRIHAIAESGLAYARTLNGLGAADLRLRAPSIPARLEETSHAAAP